MSEIEIDHHLHQQLQNTEIPLGEILKEKGFVDVNQIEEALEVAQEQDQPLGVVLLSLGYVSQAQLKIALQDQAAIKKISKRKMGKKRRLGDILMAAGVLTEEQLAGALEFSVAHGVRIGDALVQLGIITEDELAKSVGEQLMIPYIKLSKTPPDPLILDKVHARMAQKHLVMPVKAEDDQLFLAMVDPQNILVIDDIEMSTGLKVVPMIVSEKDFKNSFEAHYGEGSQADSLIEMIEDEEDKSLEEMAGEDFDENSAPIKNLMNKVVSSAIEKGTSDIHIEPFEHQLLIRFRIDGMLRNGTAPMPVKVALPISSRIKVMAGLDISEVRLPQDGKFRMSLKGKVVDVRVSTCPVAWGEKIVMRILDQSGSRLRLNSLGLDPENLDILTEGLAAPNGIILVTGPTGSGKTTTLYSSLVSLNKPSVNIQTAEDPVEYDLPGIAQAQCIPEIGMTFAAVLKAFLRQDPDIILIGEIRDMETAQIALKAALTGHLVLSTLHTNSSVESVGRLLNMGIDRFLISSAVRIILAQRLMRRLCEKCKEVHRVSKRELKSAGINERLFKFKGTEGFNPDKLTLYRAVGCKECLGNGYKGRMAIHEIMEMHDQMAVGINKELSTIELKKIARDCGMLTLRDSGLIRAVQGHSTIEEVDRLTVNEDKTAADDGDEDLIDEILIRSGSWKLSNKEILKRKKQGKYVPGDKGTLPAFFRGDDVYEMEKELDTMESDEANSGSEGGGVVDSKVLEDILNEVRSFGESVQGSGGGPDLTPALKDATQTAKKLAQSPPEKIQKLAKRMFGKLEHQVQLIQTYQEEIDLTKKNIPIGQAFLKDIYNRMPRVASQLGSRIGQKIDMSKIKISKDLAKEKVYVASDWSYLKLAIQEVLDNHLEAIREGGALKIKSKFIPSEKNKAAGSFEISFQDNNKAAKDANGQDLAQAGVSTRKARLGLGLAVAQKIVQLHEGELSIQVIPSKGCLTKLTFPCKRPKS